MFLLSHHITDVYASGLDDAALLTFLRTTGSHVRSVGDLWQCVPKYLLAGYLLERLRQSPHSHTREVIDLCNLKIKEKQLFDNSGGKNNAHWMRALVDCINEVFESLETEVFNSAREHLLSQLVESGLTVGETLNVAFGKNVKIGVAGSDKGLHSIPATTLSASVFSSLVAVC